MHINDLDPDRILLVGDVHGSIQQVRRALDVAQAAGVNVVVQLGDFGVWPGSSGEKFLADVKAELAQRETWLLFVDGNHEDFPQLYSYPLDPEDGTRPLGPYLAHLPRGLRWEWGGVRFAALGGAHSVDRPMRLEGKSWWPEEWVSDAELDAYTAGGEVDVLLMHDSPSGAPNAVVDDPNDLGRLFFSQAELYTAATHRMRLASVVNRTSPRWLFHGHYHRYMTGSYTPDGADRECFVVGLDEGGARWQSEFVRVFEVADGLL